MYKYIVPVSGSDRTVAYREFASGHDCLLHSPETLYSFRQKFCSFVVLFQSKLLVERCPLIKPKSIQKKKKKKEPSAVTGHTNFSLYEQNC